MLDLFPPLRDAPKNFLELFYSDQKKKGIDSYTPHVYTRIPLIYTLHIFCTPVNNHYELYKLQ